MVSEVEPISSLPIIDFSKKETLKPNTQEWKLACKDVKEALEEYGCFIIIYPNNVTSEFRSNLFGAMKQLFDDVPIQTKMKNKYDSKPLNGYVGQIPLIPLHESLGIDNATTLEGTQNFTNLMWPNGNDHFCETAYSFAKIAKEIDEMVTRMVFQSYGLEKYYDSYAASITYLLRLLKNRARKENESSLGFVAHTDKSFTAILHQNHINALEVKTKNGDWIKVEMPSPSSFVFVAGDALMAWSNDRIQSPMHRVMIDEKHEDRYSLAQFSFGNGMVEVPKELVDEEHPLQYKPFDHIGLLRFYNTEEGRKLPCPIKAYAGV